MFQLSERLRALDQDIRIGVVGIGSIGKGMALQPQFTPGIECVAIADLSLDVATRWAKEIGREYLVVSSSSEMHDAIRQGKLAVCEDGRLVAECELVDVFMEATSTVEEAARFLITAIQHEKHAVSMNYEADLMFGPYLMQLADEKGVVYSACDGDQPASTRHVIDELQFMGFQLVMAGNIKGYLDRYVDPTSIIPEADKRDLDYRMCSAYTDGSKLCVEQAVIANAYGLRTDVPGMHGPRMAHTDDVFDHFDFGSLWDGETGLVDYVLDAKPRGGVFAVGYTEHFHQMRTLEWYPTDIGPGPFYVFNRPYHLGHFESMATVARAALDGQSVLKPDFGMVTNVYSYAKKDLKAGDTLDGMGGYACYGLIENVNEDAEAPGIPICLAEAVTLKKDVPKDGRVLLEDVDYDPGAFGFDLYEKSVGANRDV
jgi:predicted homoserine dehydrogenase-like protein